MKKLLYSLTAPLFLVMCVIPASAHSHPNDPVLPDPIVSSWAQEEVQEALDLGFVPDLYTGPFEQLTNYRVPITRAQFRSIAMDYVAFQQHCDSSSFKGMVKYYLAEMKDEYSVKKVFTDGDEDDSLAYYLGLVEGRGNGTFDPDGLITRQEAAVMLTRAYGVCGGTLPEEEVDTSFTDEERLADWAKESVSALATWNVMKGMDDGSFSTEGNYTVEQCIVTFLRLYENAPVSRKNGNISPLFTYEQSLMYVANRSNTNTEEYRLEGSASTFIRLDSGAVMHAGSFFYFVYRDGGVRRIHMSISDRALGFSPNHKLDNSYYSEDGKTFFFTMTIEEDTISSIGPSDKKGIYHITVDVDTGKCQVQIEPLPV